jgi:RNHCP domain-containing protein
MRASRKKPLRLDSKTHDWNKRHFYDDEEGDDYSRKRRKPRYHAAEEVFKCRHCHRFVCPPASGGQHRNHCPYCLYSRHVDDRKPGDRMSTCGCSMEPIAHFQRPNGEYVIVHHCHGCDFERFNRIAADDDFDLVLSLPAQTPRTSREMKAQQAEVWLAEHAEEWEEDMEEAG